MKWYQLGADVVEQKLHVTAKQGLAGKQVHQRQKQYGENRLISDQKTSKWLLFFSQFQDFMVLILLAATLVAGMLGEYIDAIAIMVIVLVNGILGFFQEQRAEDSLSKLKEMAAPVAQVLRDGTWQKVFSQELVVGDVVRVNSGDRIPADIRITQSNYLETEESALTGESMPVTKHASPISSDKLDVQDQVNMGFMNTIVTRGSGTGIVVGTGMDTVMGQIASLMAETEKSTTPLEHKLAELGKVLISVALFLTALVVLVGVYQGHDIYNMFLAGVSLAVAAIPEGLPAIVTVALSLGVQRMIKKRAIVRELSAVETLGCASVICSDKTGTMTENKMTVKSLYLNNQYVSVTGDGYDIEGNFYAGQQEISRDFPNLESMFLYGMLCNNASLKVQKGYYYVDGDPTDGALLLAARKLGLSYQLQENFTVVKEFPFESDRKRMSIVVEDEQNMRFLITKGAPEIILPRSQYILNENGRKRMEHDDEQSSQEAVDDMADNSLRTLAIAMKPLTKNESLEAVTLENNLTFIGLYGMMDPPREGVKTAIEETREAGIKSVMITGDHEKTAWSIAEQLNLLPENGVVLNGNQIDRMTVEEMRDIIDDVYVFARVSPEHKLKIVEAFQEKGHIVAMTGDGVNDAPAIKTSDIGISMGDSGTDVTKEASSLILMDDNFTTIKSAIVEGRNIYENIRKFIRYLLASNVGEILVMLFAMLLAMPLPLVPVQILWVNLVTDGLPAMALGVDQSEDDVMKRGPRDPKEGIFARGLGFQVVSRGFLIGIVSLVAFITAYDNDPDRLVYAQTIAFATLVIAQLIHVFDCRSSHSIFSRNPFENKFLLLAVLSSVLLILVVIYWTPLQPIFHTTFLGLRDWVLVLGLGFIPSVFFGFSKR